MYTWHVPVLIWQLREFNTRNVHTQCTHDMSLLSFDCWEILTREMYTPNVNMTCPCSHLTVERIRPDCRDLCSFTERCVLWMLKVLHAFVELVNFRGASAALLEIQVWSSQRIVWKCFAAKMRHGTSKLTTDVGFKRTRVYEPCINGLIYDRIRIRLVFLSTAGPLCQLDGPTFTIAIADKYNYSLSIRKMPISFKLERGTCRHAIDKMGY